MIETLLPKAKYDSSINPFNFKMVELYVLQTFLISRWGDNHPRKGWCKIAPKMGSKN